jgi:hypothetical protein
MERGRRSLICRRKFGSQLVCELFLSASAAFPLQVRRAFVSVNLLALLTERSKRSRISAFAV